MDYVYIMFISLIYSIVLNLVFLKKSHIKTRETFYYSILLIVNLLGLIFEIICTFVGNVFPVNSFLPAFFTKVYMSFLTIFIYYICLYIYSLCLENKQQKFLLIKKVFTVILIISTIITFYLPITTSKGYATGPAVNFVYSIGIIYVTLASIIVILNHKKINFKKVIPFFLFIIFSGIVSLIQKYNPRITLTTSIEFLVVFVMYFTIENPDLKIIEELTNAKMLSEKTSNEKNSFLHIVTDDIENKISLIEKKYDNIMNLKPSTEIKSELTEIKQILNTAKIKIKQTIDVSQMDAKNLKIVNSTYNIEQLVNSIYIKTKGIVNDNVNYTLNINGDLPQELYGDPIKIKQIILTLINNSIKYTTSGYIEFRVNSIIKNDICRLIIAVEDSGTGVDVNIQNDILNNHEDLTEEDLKLLNESDLNLKIVKKIVSFVGGTFIIANNEKKGTTVTITIDQKINARNRTEEEIMIDNYSNTIKNSYVGAIISVNSSSIKTIKSVLKKQNYNINEYDGTKKCLDDIRNNKKFDVIFIDEDMEKIDAYSFLLKVKKEKAFTGRIIVLTNTKDIKGKKELIDNGFAGVVSVPVNRKELLETIKF